MPGFRTLYFLFILFLIGASTGCSTSGRTVATSAGTGIRSEAGASTDQVDPALRHETLNAVLWVQTSVEYAALAEGAYALAALRLDEALADPSWTASLEQLQAGRFGTLPPAVVLDVDETVLDNSAYQARLIEEDRPFEGATWADWVTEAKADATPGALAFTRYAASKGVVVFYLTNRDAIGEEATRNNLEALGFPLRPDIDTIVTQGERPDWAPSDKTPRRAFIAGSHRILLLIGDNYGDFSEAASGTPAERARRARDHASLWGKKWIMLPNPMYGSWDATLYDFSYGSTESEKLDRKHRFLNTNR